MAIKLFLTDVDGVMTDGSMYYTESGDELKRFHTHDGMAFELLRKAGIKTGIVTSEDTQIVARRAAKIKADYLYQGKRDGGKLAAAQQICQELNIGLEEVAYVGDDSQLLRTSERSWRCGLSCQCSQGHQGNSEHSITRKKRRRWCRARVCGVYFEQQCLKQRLD